MDDNSNLPYRVSVDGSTLAAFGSYADASAFAEARLRTGSTSSVTLTFSLTAI